MRWYETYYSSCDRSNLGLQVDTEFKFLTEVFKMKFRENTNNHIDKLI